MKILFGGKTNWAENNADNRASTWSYDGRKIVNGLVNFSEIVLFISIVSNTNRQDIVKPFIEYQIALILQRQGYVP
jgi:hypothetical protein